MGKKKKKKTITVRRAAKPKSYKGKLRDFHIPKGLPTPTEIRDELEGYEDILNGRQDPPLDRGIMTLMETAEGYFSRACEIERQILRGKAEGWLPKTAGYESLRTQEIRSFKELAKAATELGSRRITYENLRFQQETRGLESL
jgi:hypothetical protein